MELSQAEIEVALEAFETLLCEWPGKTPEAEHALISKLLAAYVGDKQFCVLRSELQSRPPYLF